ncbi:hypothetical protein [Natrinema sp. H-ect4]|uniref:hypothetical protein n=1 Tax=Natrinema sp. H-ect4 TaxID=3242699 RepID=UPI0035A8F50E
MEKTDLTEATQEEVDEAIEDIEHDQDGGKETVTTDQTSESCFRRLLAVVTSITLFAVAVAVFVSGETDPGPAEQA